MEIVHNSPFLSIFMCWNMKETYESTPISFFQELLWKKVILQTAAANP